MKKHTAKKIVVVTEKIISDDVTQFMEECGVSGYTLKSAGGKGSRGARSNERHSLNDANSNIQIESIIIDADLAQNIAEKVADEFFTNYSGIVYLEDVTIIRPEKFLKS